MLTAHRALTASFVVVGVSSVIIKISSWFRVFLDDILNQVIGAFKAKLMAAFKFQRKYFGEIFKANRAFLII